jgi:hypothetical protein
LSTSVVGIWCRNLLRKTWLKSEGPIINKSALSAKKIAPQMLSKLDFDRENVVNKLSIDDTKMISD